MMPRILTPIAAAMLLLPVAASAQFVSTLADTVHASGDIAVDPDGNIYVADYGDVLSPASGTQVLKFTPDGVVTVFADGLLGASGNEFGPDGALYQSNIALGAISRIDLLGNVTTYSTGHAAPVGIAFDGDGNMYVSNCGNNTIAKVDTGGVRTTLASDPLLACPNGLTFAADGNLYTCNFNDGNVLRIELDGTVSLFGFAPGGNAGHLVYGDGALWVVSRGGHRVFRFDLATGARRKVVGYPFPGNSDGDVSVATLTLPNGIGFSPDGTKIYVNSKFSPVGQNLNPVYVREIDVSGVVDAPDLEEQADRLGLRTWPSPARTETRVEYVLPRPGLVSLTIHDVAGRRVRTLENGFQGAGRHALTWDRVSDGGEPVAAGIYFYSLESGDRRVQERVILLR
jgi:sugar lactone lactonase YvrE